MEDRESEYMLITMKETYKIIMGANPWPRGYTTTEKIKFIDRLTDYFTGVQMFEECEELQRKRQQILQGI